MKQTASKKSAAGNGSAKARSSNQASHAEGLRTLFEDQLKDIYWAEKKLTKAIPKMIKNATSAELIKALKDHLKITEQQVSRCEKVFATLKVKAQGSKCEAMEGLVKEATEIMESTEKGSVRDAGIICAAQKVEHYEIATYGTLVAFAQRLGEDKAASLLEQTLNEEKEADSTLSSIAESSVNAEAMML